MASMGVWTVKNGDVSARIGAMRAAALLSGLMMTCAGVGAAIAAAARYAKMTEVFMFAVAPRYAVVLVLVLLLWWEI